MQGWYGIMPNNILFDNTLSDKSKLLFCLISSLCSEKWYCRATNEYLAEQLGVTGRTIRERVSELQDHWYIAVLIEDGFKRTIRVIWGEENFQGGGEKVPQGDGKKLPYSNITSSKSTKEEKIQALENRLKNEYHLPEKVVQMALIFDNTKPGKTKVREFGKPQLTAWVNKLRKDGLDCEDGMIMTLEKSIASWYQGTTPIKPRELKKKEEPSQNTLFLH